MLNTITFPSPDDWHVHFRDQDVLTDTVFATAKHFARALAMPNLQPPLTSLASLLDYRKRLLAAVEKRADQFIPYMTFYLNDTVSPEDLSGCADHPEILGAKLYPAGSTTNASQGATSIKALYPLLDLMQDQGLVLQIHGELGQGDIFEREASFIKLVLSPLLKQFPKLRVVLEHISTREAVAFVTDGPETLAATITPHHLRYNRNDLLADGIKPHYYCLPILKHELDQRAIQSAATSGNPKFFAGTDSAPHRRSQKEQACGCAGIYSAPFALAYYADTFEQLGQLSRLPAFASHFGADFYQLPRNQSEITLIKKPQRIPATLPMGNDVVVPMGAGTSLSWSIHEPTT